MLSRFQICSLESVKDTEELREWLVSAFAKPLLKGTGKLVEASLEEIDNTLAENPALDSVRLRFSSSARSLVFSK